MCLLHLSMNPLYQRVFTQTYSTFSEWTLDYRNQTLRIFSLQQHTMYICVHGNNKQTNTTSPFLLVTQSYLVIAVLQTKRQN